jgi:hypothetical protein
VRTRGRGTRPNSFALKQSRIDSAAVASQIIYSNHHLNSVFHLISASRRQSVALEVNKDFAFAVQF